MRGGNLFRHSAESRLVMMAAALLVLGLLAGGVALAQGGGGDVNISASNCSQVQAIFIQQFANNEDGDEVGSPTASPEPTTVEPTTVEPTTVEPTTVTASAADPSLTKERVASVAADTPLTKEEVESAVAQISQQIGDISQTQVLICLTQVKGNGGGPNGEDTTSSTPGEDTTGNTPGEDTTGGNVTNSADVVGSTIPKNKGPLPNTGGVTLLSVVAGLALVATGLFSTGALIRRNR